MTFTDALHYYHIEPNPEMMERFDSYYHLLVEWNKVMNLTGITAYEDVLIKHFIDSLSIADAIDMRQVSTLIDIGTGAGFPGLPIKIAFPHIKVTLLDSLNKRIRFLNTVIDDLNLSDITALHGRAEDYAKNEEFREKYDLCVSRAVANLASLSEYCIPYVKKGGRFIAYKSGEIDEELLNSQNAIQILGGKVEQTVRFSLPDTDIDRTLILINKEQLTNRKYPRKAGMPTKEPL